jgi:hypothetical protein
VHRHAGPTSHFEICIFSPSFWTRATIIQVVEELQEIISKMLYFSKIDIFACTEKSDPLAGKMAIHFSDNGGRCNKGSRNRQVQPAGSPPLIPRVRGSA